MKTRHTIKPSVLAVVGVLAALGAHAQRRGRDRLPRQPEQRAQHQALSDGIVDVIKAEDIAKFPDANLAESLQRVPGVSLTRGDGGEGKQITVRGLNAGFTRVRINGIEGVTATGASDINGSTNRGRGFDFSVFASELFNSLEVRKTSEAAVEEGSLGATVDLRTARPFDFKGRTFSLGAQGVHNNSLSDKTEPRVTACIRTAGKPRSARSARWSRRPTPSARAGGRLRGGRVAERQQRRRLLLAGWLCAAEPGQQRRQGHRRRQLRLRRAAHLEPGRLQQRHGPHRQLWRHGGHAAAAGSGAFAPRIPRYRRSLTEYERTGLTSFGSSGVPTADRAEPRPAGRQVQQHRYDNYISAISFGRSLGQANGKPQTSILETHFNENGSWDYGKFNGVDVRSEGLLDKYTTCSSSTCCPAAATSPTAGSVDFLSGIIEIGPDEPMRATVQFDSPNVNGFSFDFRNNRNVPTLNFGIDVANPNNFSFAPAGSGRHRARPVRRPLPAHPQQAENQRDQHQLRAQRQHHLAPAVSQARQHLDNVEIGSGGNGLTLPAGVTMASITRQISGFGNGLGGTGVPSSWAAVDLTSSSACTTSNATARPCPAPATTTEPGQPRRRRKDQGGVPDGRLQLRRGRSRCAAISACAKRRPTSPRSRWSTPAACCSR
jgi:iron complex outermembrane receptor protein